VRLKSKVALITGAAHGVEGELMGFGGAAAWLFAREGAKVIVTDVEDATGETTASQIRQSGGQCAYMHLDVTSQADWGRAARKIDEDFGRLDVLVNNAGVAHQEGLETTTLDAWDFQSDVHGKGTLLGMQMAVPMMRKTGGGSIVNVSSIYAVIGSKGSTAYHAAKGAVLMLTKAAAVQYAPENIRVNAVLPGFANTPLVSDPNSSPGFDPSRIGEKIPIGRFATAEEIAHGIVFLASDESSYITGAELAIDGGMAAI
jgi:NAD(P)-dependent dehydrogenase (short-subunit alcohol dehydrogenase family)